MCSLFSVLQVRARVNLHLSFHRHDLLGTLDREENRVRWNGDVVKNKAGIQIFSHFWNLKVIWKK